MQNNLKIHTEKTNEDTMDPKHQLLAMLESAVTKRDFGGFTALIEKGDLAALSPQNLLRVIDLSLSLDMIPLAEELVATARATFPDDLDIERAAKALAPPRVVGTRPPQTTGIRESNRWFQENASKYKGQWIAVNNGTLLATGVTLKTLKKKLPADALNCSTIVVKVLS